MEDTVSCVLTSEVTSLRLHASGHTDQLWLSVEEEAGVNGGHLGGWATTVAVKSFEVFILYWKTLK